MDLADVTDIALPEGDVLKIEDESGRVLWEKKLKEYTLVIQADNGIEKAQKEFSIIVEPSNNSLFAFAVQIKNELEFIQQQFSIEMEAEE